MGSCVVCAWFVVTFAWVYEWYIPSQIFIVPVVYVCISDEPSVCCVCGYI